MFYETNPIEKIRFGDILQSFYLSSCLNCPPISLNPPNDFKVDLSFFRYVAILTPCCTIAQKSGNVLLVTPLVKIAAPLYFENSFFQADLTSINREMTPEEAVGPERWTTLSEDEKLERGIGGRNFTLLHNFVYDKHDLLEEYELPYKNGLKANISYYMIDFRKIFKIEYKPDWCCSKLLQLSESARSDLRKKMAFYFGRPPEEDLI